MKVLVEGSGPVGLPLKMNTVLSRLGRQGKESKCLRSSNILEIWSHERERKQDFQRSLHMAGNYGVRFGQIIDSPPTLTLKTLYRVQAYYKQGMVCVCAWEVFVLMTSCPGLRDF